MSSITTCLPQCSHVEVLCTLLCVTSLFLLQVALHCRILSEAGQTTAFCRADCQDRASEFADLIL